MLNNPLINLSLRVSYDTLSKNSQKVHNGFVALVADYPLPNPLMPAFQLDINALDAGILAWGPKGARGSHEDHLVLIDAAEVVRAGYRQLAAYAMNTKPGNPTSWVALGFSVRRAKTPPVSLESVQDFHLFVARSVGDGLIKLKWKRPLNAQSNDVKSYIIQCSNVAVPPPMPDGHAVINYGIIDIVTKTSVILNPPFIGANYFWVIPLNAAGFGKASAVVMYNNPGKI